MQPNSFPLSRGGTGIAFGLLLWALAWLDPSPASAHPAAGFATHQGVRIAYEIEGEGDPIVLLPGLSQSRRAWRDAGFVQAFVARGRRVVLIDPRGHGDSAKPHDPAAYDARALAGDVVAVLDRLGIERADILGYSRGGAIAIATAIRFPERCRSIIVGGAHPYAQDMSRYRRAVAAGLPTWLAAIEAQAGPLPAAAREMVLGNDVDALRAAVSNDRPDRSAALARSGVPALFYVGARDPIRSSAERYAAAAGTRLLLLEDANHMQAFFRVEPVVAATEALAAGLAD